MKMQRLVRTKVNCHRSKQPDLTKYKKLRALLFCFDVQDISTRNQGAGLCLLFAAGCAATSVGTVMGERDTATSNTQNKSEWAS